MLAPIGFAAGLNVYATVAALGLLARFGHLSLPPGLQLLESWMVIVASSALFAIEFVADKTPAFDLIWNALHTFVRVPIAALLAFQATRQLSREHNSWRLCWAPRSPSPHTVARSPFELR